jgi:hypothetical protein
MTPNPKTFGVKILKPDGQSLNGKYTYDLSGAWNVVPGNGAYVAVSGGEDRASIPSARLVVALECEEELAEDNGVNCYRRVRVVPLDDSCSPYIKYVFARWDLSLKPKDIMRLAQDCSPEDKAHVRRTEDRIHAAGSNHVHSAIDDDPAPAH